MLRPPPSSTLFPYRRSSDLLVFFVAFGTGLPVIIVTLFYMIRWLPAGLINIPRRDFWLAGERAPETHRYLLARGLWLDRKSTRLNSSHSQISYAVFCLKKKT